MIPTSRRQSSIVESGASAAAGLPLPWPSRFPRPPTGFMRNEAPYQESFAAALQTSYLGFAVDENVTSNEGTLQATLCADLANHFRMDVTQPFGLGTPCAKTYVTRCLVGDAGTTYKYLGLRMFAHPWPSTIHDLARTLTNRVDTVHLPQLHRNRDKQRHTAHSHTDDSKDDESQLCTTTPAERPPPLPLVRRGGRASRFDVCLINRMTARHPHLKAETLDPTLRTTVSWHADSSLEHYSTIAVYQTLMREAVLSSTSSLTISSPVPPDTMSHWSVALRVSPHAEGPGSTSLKRSEDKHEVRPTKSQGGSSGTADAPPIAISLPSNSAYYLLDDFNHHHQHTVLTSKTTTATKAHSKANKYKRSKATTPAEAPGDDDWIRYSLTFRLLRESHNVEHMLQRCERTIKSFHKRKTTKLVRSQQLLLTELETEWLRQFYIQGSHHATLLWPSWHLSIRQLWQYWTRLEERTLQTIVWLQHAAQGQCFSSVTPPAESTTTTGTASVVFCKSERKLRDKRRKAATALHELLDRESKDHHPPALQRVVADGHDSDDDIVGGGTIFEELAGLLDARATMRELWTRRESDPAFRDLQGEHKPIPFPAQFQGANNIGVDVPNESLPEAKPRTDDDHRHGLGVSPMPGTASELRKLASHLRAFERAFHSGSNQDLPRDEMSLLNEPAGKDTVLVGPTTNGVSSKGEVLTPNSMDIDWSGWGDVSLHFGLEMQCPWAEAILNGSKSIETRSYSLPTGLVGRRIMILQSPHGNAGVSALGNIITLTERSYVNVIGWCRFSAVISYDSRQEFCADEQRHGVIASSGFGWKDDSKVIFGWVVEEYGRGDHNVVFQSGTRRFRSLFELHSVENNGTNKLTPNVGRRAKKQAKGGRSPGSGGQQKKKRRF